MPDVYTQHEECIMSANVSNISTNVSFGSFCLQITCMHANIALHHVSTGVTLEVLTFDLCLHNVLLGGSYLDERWFLSFEKLSMDINFT